jgi:hypothetical protein
MQGPVSQERLLAATWIAAESSIANANHERGGIPSQSHPAGQAHSRVGPPVAKKRVHPGMAIPAKQLMALSPLRRRSYQPRVRVA